MMLHRADVLKIQEMDTRMIDEYHLDGSLPISLGELQVFMKCFLPAYQYRKRAF